MKQNENLHNRKDQNYLKRDNYSLKKRKNNSNPNYNNNNIKPTTSLRKINVLYIYIYRNS